MFWTFVTIFKGIVDPEIKISWKHTHPQVIQDVDEFVSSSDLEKCIIASLARQWILCSEWYRQNESPNSNSLTRGLFRCFFISCLDSNSDGTHSLQSIYWRANDTMQWYSSTMAWRRVNSQQIFIFKWTITFTFMHFTDAFIQSDLQCIQVIHYMLSLCVFPGNWTHNLLRC